MEDEILLLSLLDINNRQEVCSLLLNVYTIADLERDDMTSQRICRKLGEFW